MFAVTLLRFIGANFIARKMRQKIVLRLFKNRHGFANRFANQYRLFLVGSDFVFGLKIGSDDRTIGEKIGSDLPILKSCDSRALV